MLREHTVIVASIVDACIDPPGKDKPGTPKYKEYIKLERFESLAGCTLYHTVDPGTPKQHLEPYFVFEKDTPVSARFVVVHSGTGSPRQIGDQYHVFSDGLVGSGHWKLNNTGEHIVLKNAIGEVVHEKYFEAHHCSLGNNYTVGAIATAVVTSSAVARSFGALD